MPPRQSRGKRQTVAGAVQRREFTDQARSDLDDQVRQALPYIKAIVPSHINAAQYVAIIIGLLHKNPELAEAAYRNTPSFLAALADAARLGLIPGDGYALVPLGVGPNSTGKPEVLGITEYTGEIDLMYRSGGVQSVIAEVIRQEDYFKRGAHPHDPPVFEPVDEGLASDEERGPLRGVFCYCVLDSGRISRVVIMGRTEVMKHKAVARTKKIWEGEFEPSMWLKTAVHEEYKWVPKSAEYRQELIRAGAALEGTPLGAVPVSSAVLLPSASPQIPAPPAGAHRAIGNGEPARPAAAAPAATGSAGTAAKSAPADAGTEQGMAEVAELFDQIGIVNSGAARLRYCKGLLAGAWDGNSELTTSQLGTLRDRLGEAISAATDDRDAEQVLRDMISGATADHG
jgi:recombination protein RecT